ncbi:MAG: right-handed parallel beta-helix repeat-containing protein [Myxococcota bacterium]|nr:right-handed parallel beta-helix repeat-containing protein [Myxococcota bacterium]
MAVRTLLLLALLSLPVTAAAADGIREINAACAAAGCFPGDAGGFPVLIVEPGSYRLTSDLLPASGALDAIRIGAGVRIVTIDLNGFRIVGTDDGTGVGIRGESGASAITVRNGTVAFMGGDGVDIGGSAVIEAVHALGNNGDGIDVNQTSLVRDSRIVGNSQFGINFNDASSLYSGNVFSGNGSGPVNLGRAGEANLCGSEVCSSTRRRFYFDPGAVPGDEALTRCEPGFHMASLFEILDPTQLRYDDSLGKSCDDSGSGPPACLLSSGWVRTGDDSSGSGARPNCNAWTDGSAASSGTVARLVRGGELDSAATAVSPWVLSEVECTGSVFTPPPNPSLAVAGLWCVED